MATEPLRDKDGNIIREPGTCKYCGETYDMSAYRDIEPGACFTCDFWNGHLMHDTDKDKERFAVIAGHHYIIADEPSSPVAMRGFSGHRFIIKFNDGRVVETTNLWHQGEITPYWRNKMTDNAVFLKG